MDGSSAHDKNSLHFLTHAEGREIYRSRETEHERGVKGEKIEHERGVKGEKIEHERGVKGEKIEHERGV